jgi:hypothetical protein
MNDIPKRRGRPRLNAPLAVEGVTEDVRPTTRRRRASVGGFHLKLSAPERKGYHRHWFVDKPGRLAEAEELAYSHVTEPGIKSDGPDSRVRRLTGTDAQGAPQYSYLMETPLDEYQAGVEDKEQAHAAFESAIQRGQDPFGGLSDSYGTGTIEGSNRG